MDKNKRLTIWTLISNCFIIVVGYPPTFLTLCGLFSISVLIGDFDAIHNFSNYDRRSIVAGLVSLCGQVLMFIFIVKKKPKPILLKTSLFIMWVGFSFLIVKVFTQEYDRLSLVFGLPFVILSIILIRRLK